MSTTAHKVNHIPESPVRKHFKYSENGISSSARNSHSETMNNNEVNTNTKQKTRRESLKFGSDRNSLLNFKEITSSQGNFSNSTNQQASNCTQPMSFSMSMFVPSDSSNPNFISNQNSLPVGNPVSMPFAMDPSIANLYAANLSGMPQAMQALDVYRKFWANILSSSSSNGSALSTSNNSMQPTANEVLMSTASHDVQVNGSALNGNGMAAHPSISAEQLALLNAFAAQSSQAALPLAQIPGILYYSFADSNYIEIFLKFYSPSQTLSPDYFYKNPFKI